MMSSAGLDQSRVVEVTATTHALASGPRPIFALDREIGTELDFSVYLPSRTRRRLTARRSMRPSATLRINNEELPASAVLGQVCR